MRAADVAEITAQIPADVIDILRQSVERSAWSRTVYSVEDGRETLVAIYGVGDYGGLPNVGVPWMLATDDLEKYQLTFLKKCKSRVQDMHDSFGTLMNYVHSKNTVSIQWLKWMGFELGDPIVMGHAGETFHCFARTN
jgi:hypothetical protein